MVKEDIRVAFDKRTLQISELTRFIIHPSPKKWVEGIVFSDGIYFYYFIWGKVL